MSFDRAKAADLYESSIAAGYHPYAAKARVGYYVKTGEIQPDPTEKVWGRQINQESGGRQSAVSSKGATGIAQVMPATGPEAADLAGLKWDPVAFKNDAAYNEAIGRAYMRKQMDDFGGNTNAALAAYNAGPGRVRQVLAGNATLPDETRNYIKSIADHGYTEQAPSEPAKMTKNDQIKAIYQKVQEAGGSQEDLRAALDNAFGKRAAPVQAPQQAQQAPMTQQTDPQQQAPMPPQQGAQPQDPTWTQKLQNDIEQVHNTQPDTAGMGRSLLGTVQGIRKLYNQATGDSGTVDQINAENQHANDYWNKTDAPGSGVSESDIGRFLMDSAIFGAAPGGGATLGGKVLAGAGTGAVQGLVQPTTANESQGANAAIGGAVGAALPLAGAAVQKVIGKLDPAREAIVNKLRTQGIDVPQGAKYDGVLPNILQRGAGDTLPEVGAGVSSNLAANIGAPGKTLSNDVIENQLSNIGGKIGDLTKGLTAAPSKDFRNKILDAGQEYLSKGLDTSPNDPVMKAAEDLLRRSQAPMTGEEAQSLRSQLSGLATKGTPQEKTAYRTMRDAIDAHIGAEIPADQQGARAGLNAQYRLAKVLRGGKGVGSEGMGVNALSAKIETAANKGGVDASTRELLQNAASVAPRAKVGVDESAANYGARAIGSRGIIEAILRSLPEAGNLLTRRGIPQSVVNSPAVGKAATDSTRNALLPILLRMNSGE